MISFGSRNEIECLTVNWNTSPPAFKPLHPLQIEIKTICKQNVEPETESAIVNDASRYS